MHIAIIGGGAAGCFAAANIPFLEGREVVLFEKTGKVLQKVKVSGGGRCNVTHACDDVREMADSYPRGKQFLRKTLYQFTPKDTTDWFELRGVKLKTEPDGRMFPVTDSSQTIIDCLWQEMMRNKVQVQYHRSVDKIDKVGEHFVIHFVNGQPYVCDKVMIATGGFPKPEQYKWLQSLGHTIQSPVPSLFTFNLPKHPITQLMGVSVPDAIVKIAGTKISTQGPLLITHWGLSGPAVLRASAWAARELNDRHYDFTILINWMSSIKDDDLKETILSQRQEHGKQLVYTKNPFGLPQRLWEYHLKQCGIVETTRWGDLPAKEQNKLMECLLRDNYHVKGKTTFKEEFVTCGGINLSEIEPKTMESRIIKGLYFAGEITDVDGITGGFNFQNAWSGGWIAAKNIIT